VGAGFRCPAEFFLTLGAGLFGHAPNRGTEPVSCLPHFPRLANLPCLPLHTVTEYHWIFQNFSDQRIWAVINLNCYEELWFNEWEFKGTPWTNRALYRKWSPHEYVTEFKTPTLVVHGQLDYRLDVSEGFQLFTTLQRLKVPSKMLYFPDEGHWVLKPQNSQLWYRTVNDWVDAWLKKH